MNTVWIDSFTSIQVVGNTVRLVGSVVDDKGQPEPAVRLVVGLQEFPAMIAGLNSGLRSLMQKGAISDARKKGKENAQAN